MERQTTKTHLEFDLAVATTTYAKLKKEMGGEQITSPFDLYAVERLRDEHNLRQDASFGTDVFVWGVGTPKRRQMTKVSGLPYWPKNREWPGASDGSPYQFLAQFNFMDSKDLVPELPGDILLLFVPQDNEDWLWETDLIRFEWAKVDGSELIDALPAGINPFTKLEWYGVIHRTSDYPEQIANARKLKELGVDQPYNLPIINGTKIGGLPHGIQSSVDYRVDSKTKLPVIVPPKKKAAVKRFLCQLTSIQAEPEVPYPWTNRRKQLTLDFDDGGIYGDDNQCLLGDMGSLYIFLDKSGKCVADCECY